MSQKGGNNTMIFITAMTSGVIIIAITLYLSGAIDMLMSL